MRSKKEQTLINALEAAACQHGFDLVDIESAGSGRNAVLRVFISKADGLTLDDVAGANTWIAEIVEAQDFYKGSYTLEVSSPGIDRPLRTFAHFENAVGEEVAITLESAVASSEAQSTGAKPRLKYTGVITGVDAQEQSVTINADDTTHTLPFSQIKKARVKGHVSFNNREDS